MASWIAVIADSPGEYEVSCSDVAAEHVEPAGGYPAVPERRVLQDVDDASLHPVHVAVQGVLEEDDLAGLAGRRRVAEIAGEHLDGGTISKMSTSEIVTRLTSCDGSNSYSYDSTNPRNRVYQSSSTGFHNASRACFNGWILL